uniref:Uncharacterized protein n=1 Tax=Anguilla anguilla TaxID=7936 RepID=A0A0E9TIE2_ANGAN
MNGSQSILNLCDCFLDFCVLLYFIYCSWKSGMLMIV